MTYKDPEYQKKYRLKNREDILLKSRKYNEEHKEEYRIWRINNKEKMQSWRDANKEMIKGHSVKNREKRREYRHRNRKKIEAQRKNRRSINIHSKLRYGLRARLNTAIKRGYKSGSAVQDLGCTIPELKFYLEGQFQDGMTWDNWTRVDLHEKAWNIDHKIPLAFFDLTDRDQLLLAVHYTNLQPMWAKDNIQKSNSLPIEGVKMTKED